MKTLIFAIALICAGILPACAMHSSTVGKTEMRPQYKLSITEDVDLQRFEIVMQSLDDRALCMDVEQWPNGLGQVDWHGRQGVLQSKEGNFTARDANFGFCPGGCGVIKIPPRSKLHGFVPFSEFGDPGKIARLQDRRLDFTVAPRICAGDEKIARTQEKIA